VESLRQRETVSTLNDVTIAGTSGNDLWNFLVATANNISDEYTYKAASFLGEVFSPAANSNSFISSILRSAQIEGYDISAFDTDANVHGNQTWLGTAGNDVLDGRIQFANGDEVEDLAFLDLSLQSVPTNDLVIGLDSDNTILTGYENDWLYGGGGVDLLNAGSDNDWIDGGAGADIIDGGEGIDVLHFVKDGAGVTVDFQTVTGDGTGVGGDAAVILSYDFPRFPCEKGSADRFKVASSDRIVS